MHVGIFQLNAEVKKQKMKKAWELFKAGVVKEYSVDKFAEFMKNNDNVMPEEIVDMVVVIGNGIAYLYN
ncbi:hypothetical protein SUGI_1122920 [Cryptomeria japonica]|nr:hypothetical protein SUGI_1122920 [Cryptomeria japonica]